MDKLLRLRIDTFAGLLTTAFLLLTGCGAPNEDQDDWRGRSFEDQVGTRFTPVKSFSFETPKVQRIPLDFAEQTSAIWGAIGRDDAGSLYFGASTAVGADGQQADEPRSRIGKKVNECRHDHALPA